MKSKWYRVAAVVSTLATLVAVSGAGHKWG